ncbi:hypothetical protein [Actibacterium pelagium]|uniref:Uncharacterized protein n=1 Tax=Actibacterium pelagium TaxID=2029103 RepID=A0A917ELF4_9RHOB|nr:hypothetical protein [Actibacterium pelagium]GGE53162.1 hypothetical protein GCM10011517_21200 [Actibacterium pelagium]
MRLPLIALLLSSQTALADPAEIVEASAKAQGSGDWNISVTLRHPDTGWDHYADGWEVLSPDGTRLGFRELLHPHVNEQPFKRSLGGVTIPAGLDHVLIRAKCSVDGWGKDLFRLDLP